MSQELNTELATWWDEQAFAGKELYRLDDQGTLILLAGPNMKERTVATLSVETGDTTMKNLIAKFATLEAKVVELQAEWESATDKLKLYERVAYLKDLLANSNAIGNYKPLAALVQHWDEVLQAQTQEHYETKVKLAELAESLAMSEQWKEATQQFKDISDLWKQTGHVDRHRNDKLWNRIEAARRTFFDRKRVQHEEEEKDRLVNLDLKLDLVQQAESMANSLEWKTATETYHRLTEEWKTIGHTINKKNEELWQRFLAAKTIFFDRKREHYSIVQAEQEASYAVKLAIVEKAEALRESRDWNATAQAYAALMEEWKKSGRVQQQKADELWKRYNAAQEQFFDAKKKHFEAIRLVQENNYQLKKALLDRADQLKESSYWSDATAEMNELMEEWRKIGHIAREHGDKMWEDFNAARRHFFARKDASRDQKRQQIEAQKAARQEQDEAQKASRAAYEEQQRATRQAQEEAMKAAKQAEARNAIQKTFSDLKEEQEKLADFTIAIQNITPGKKAAELKAHLENLIAECKANIVVMQAKCDALKPKEAPAKIAEPEAETADEAQAVVNDSSAES